MQRTFELNEVILKQSNVRYWFDFLVPFLKIKERKKEKSFVFIVDHDFFFCNFRCPILYQGGVSSKPRMISQLLNDIYKPEVNMLRLG